MRHTLESFASAFLEAQKRAIFGESVPEWKIPKFADTGAVTRAGYLAGTEAILAMVQEALNERIYHLMVHEGAAWKLLNEVVMRRDPTIAFLVEHTVRAYSEVCESRAHAQILSDLLNKRGELRTALIEADLLDEPEPERVCIHGPEWPRTHVKGCPDATDD